MKQRLFLTFDRVAINTPILSQMTNRFEVMFNIFGATVNETTQFIALELEGEQDRVDGAIAFLEAQGVKVESSEGQKNESDGLA